MRYSQLPINELITYFRSRGKEGDFWDFKQEWHEKIEDLIKDIVCFSNTVHDENCYIIFGVADDLSITGMSGNQRMQADILDAISNLVFAGDNHPIITVESVIYENTLLDVLIIHNTDKTPIYLKKPYGNMLQGCVYARVGDRNTPDKGNAEIQTIEDLWKKRFGLLKSPLEYIFDALLNKHEWSEREYGYYHIYRPEYTLERMNENYNASFFRNEEEFYSYAQTNELTTFDTLAVKAKGTILEEYQIVILDSGMLSIPVPEWGFIYFDDYHQDYVSYKYYIKGSHSETLLRFMYTPEDIDQRCAFRKMEKVTLFYKNEQERESFEEYVSTYRDDLKHRIEESDEYDYIITDNENKTNVYKKALKAAVALKEMLEEYRDSLNIDIHLND